MLKIHRLVAIAFIVNHKSKSCVDHINNNKTDNNVNNLRFATKSENSFNAALSIRNKAGIKGVYYRKRDKIWEAQIACNGKRINIGSYKTLEEAKNARINTAKELFGEYINSCEK